MTNRRTFVAGCLLAALGSVLFATGCQSVKTVRMYSGPDVSSYQLATLVVPWCINVRTVDGLPVPLALVDEMRMSLKPGAHALEARFVVLFPIGNGDTEKITSDYIPLTFTAEPGKTYKVCSKDPKSLQDARRYAAHVSLWIQETVTGPVKGAAAATPAAPATPLSIPSTKGVASATAAKAENPDIQAQLQQIWEKADEQDRKAFLDKVRPQHP